MLLFKNWYIQKKNQRRFPLSLFICITIVYKELKTLRKFTYISKRLKINRFLKLFKFFYFVYFFNYFLLSCYIYVKFLVLVNWENIEMRHHFFVIVVISTWDKLKEVIINIFFKILVLRFIYLYVWLYLSYCHVFKFKCLLMIY